MKKIVYAVFAKERDATAAAFALANSKLRASIRSSGVASEALAARPIGKLKNKRRHNLITRLGITGMLIGCLAAFYNLPALHAVGRELMFLAFVPIGGAYVGLGLGLMMAMLLADLFKLDNSPGVDSNVYLGNVLENDFLLSVAVGNTDEFKRAQSLLVQCGAILMSVKAASNIESTISNESKNELEISELQFELGRTA